MDPRIPASVLIVSLIVTLFMMMIERGGGAPDSKWWPRIGGLCLCIVPVSLAATLIVLLWQ